MLKITQYYIICNYTYSLSQSCHLNVYLNLEKEIVVDSDDNINDDDKEKIVENKKKIYQKKPEEKTSKQDNVRHFIVYIYLTRNVNR